MGRRRRSYGYARCGCPTSRWGCEHNQETCLNNPANRRRKQEEMCMLTLVYKRIRTGDTDGRGCFGEQDCMGSVRNLGFHALIGVGGRGREAHA
jgi:hypothetical protein